MASNNVVPKKSVLRFTAFAAVLVLTSGLVLALFEEARAIDMPFQTAPSTTAGATNEFVVDIVVPQNTRVPVETITGIIEKQATGESSKFGAVVQTRADCGFTGTPSSQCTLAGTPALSTSGPQPNAITSITFNGFLESNGYSVSSGYFTLGPITGTYTGYGYNTGYGYGYTGGPSGAFPAGNGYGYGYGNDDLTMRFTINVNGAALTAGVHYLTVLFDSGSGTIGSFSSEFAQFTNNLGGGGGGGTTQPPSDGAPITVTARAVTPPAGATAAFRATGVTQTAGDSITITTNSDFIGEVVFTPSSDLDGATIDIVHYPADNPPPGVGNVPPGLELAGFVQVTISSGGTSHTVTMAITIPPGQAEGNDPSKAVLLKWSEGDGMWVSKGRITLTENADGSLDGSGTSDCCSNYAVAFDEEDPEVTLSVPSGTLSGSETVTAEASDNLEIAKVEFYVDDTLVSTDTESPYSYSLNTASYANGAHTIRAVAYDLVDNTAESTATSSFDNEDAPPGPGGNGPGAGEDGGLPWGTILIILIVIAIIGFAGYYFYQQSQKK